MPYCGQCLNVGKREAPPECSSVQPWQRMMPFQLSSADICSEDKYEVRRSKRGPPLSIAMFAKRRSSLAIRLPAEMHPHPDQSHRLSSAD